MAQVIWTEPALQDLNAIADYIALDNLRAARELVKRVFARVELLEKFPHLGRVPPEIPDLPYRQLVVSPCRIFYRIGRKAIHIIHVLRGERFFRVSLLEECDDEFWEE